MEVRVLNYVCYHVSTFILLTSKRKLNKLLICCCVSDSEIQTMYLSGFLNIMPSLLMSNIVQYDITEIKIGFYTMLMFCELIFSFFVCSPGLEPSEN